MKKDNRCPWAQNDLLMATYHDLEWGVPVHNDQKLFEFLILEGAQAGLSWLTVLRKRENYRRLFAKFDPEKIARFGKRETAKLLKDEGIIRNRLKIEAAISNAKVFLKIQEKYGSFDQYSWQFVEGKPVDHRLKSLKQIPATNSISDAFSKDLKQHGFRFVGSTIIYAHMQAVGMVNDHLIDCFRYRQIKKLR